MAEAKYTQKGVFRTPRTQAQSIGTDGAGWGNTVPGQTAPKPGHDSLFANPQPPKFPTDVLGNARK